MKLWKQWTKTHLWSDHRIVSIARPLNYCIYWWWLQMVIFYQLCYLLPIITFGISIMQLLTGVGIQSFKLWCLWLYSNHRAAPPALRLVWGLGGLWSYPANQNVLRSPALETGFYYRGRRYPQKYRKIFSSVLIYLLVQSNTQISS